MMLISIDILKSRTCGLLKEDLLTWAINQMKRWLSLLVHSLTIHHSFKERLCIPPNILHCVKSYRGISTQYILSRNTNKQVLFVGGNWSENLPAMSTARVNISFLCLSNYSFISTSFTALLKTFVNLMLMQYYCTNLLTA